MRTSVMVARLSRLLADAMRCPDCGKTIAMLNTNLLRGRRGVQLEKVTPETHCACPPSDTNRYGGPAFIPKGPTDADALIERGIING